MHAYIDFDNGPVFAIPARDGWHGFAGCEGMLLEGPQGWGEFSPPAAVAGVRAARYLTAAIEADLSGLIAPDETTFAYLQGRPMAPKGADWDQAVAYWRTLPSDANGDVEPVDGAAAATASRCACPACWRGRRHAPASCPPSSATCCVARRRVAT